MARTAKTKMALKPYSEAVKGHCGSLSKDELLETILQLALKMPVGARVSFLESICAVVLMPASGEEKARRRKKPTKGIEEITLKRIEALREEIEERIASIEEGTYWDDRDDWDRYGMTVTRNRSM